MYTLLRVSPKLFLRGLDVYKKEIIGYFVHLRWPRTPPIARIISLNRPPSIRDYHGDRHHNVYVLLHFINLLLAALQVAEDTNAGVRVLPGPPRT